MNTQARTIGHSFAAFAGDIKLAHSIFALPFAASAFVIGHLPLPTIGQTVSLLLAMVSARSFAMGMNRYIDRNIDAENPRTTQRGIPSQKLSERAALGWCGLSAVCLLLAAFTLSKMAGILSVPLLFVLAFYSYWKRFSWLAHWYLGLCLGFAPVAVCIAIKGSAPLAVTLLGIAITMWTAGFDILYSLQDIAFDRGKGLRSIPSRFGPAPAILVSRSCFITMITLLLWVGHFASRGAIYYAGVLAIALILFYEQYLIRDAKLTGKSKNISAAFFNANAYVSVAFFAAVVADYWIGL